MMLLLVVTVSIIAAILISVWAYKKVNNNNQFFKLNKVLNDQLDLVQGQVKVGDIGKCISRLAPMGRAMINNQEFEVTSSSNYIDENSIVVVSAVHRNKIVVNLKVKE